MSECVFCLSNSDGVLIYVETQSRKLKKYMERHNFLVNALWNEESAGTNAVSMALEERTNIFLRGYEHYSYGWHPYCCAASPIFHPQSREIVGVVDLSSFCNDLHLHSMGWVAAMARLIEAGLGMHILKCDNKNKPSKKNSHFFINNNPAVKNPPLKVIGKDPAFLSALKLAEKAAKTDLNVLLTGETGTGKEVFAKAMHSSSTRAAGPFVAVNCGAIPRELMVSELFGYLDGAFTGASRRGHPGRFEQADGGTIFLDEIGDAPHEVQVCLLRVVEEGCVYRLGAVRPAPVNDRVLAATSRDLSTLVRDGDFRKDLYYRLSGVNINIPPLREHKEDIPLLAEHFLEGARERTGRYNLFSDELIQAFLEYDWPGNVRELKNTVERLAGLTEDEVVSSELLYHLMPGKNMPFLKLDMRNKSSPNHNSHENSLSFLKLNPKKDALIEAMKEAGGSVSRVAEKMGINRSTIYRRMKKYGIEND